MNENSSKATYRDSIEQYRERGAIFNSFGNGPKWTMEDLPLDNEQKELVLEWFAHKMWRFFREMGIQDGYCKSYDPLSIDGHTAHSYIFDLGDGGRHHRFTDLAELEDRLCAELTTQTKEWIEDEYAERTDEK